jgi:uncharacterized damage-inducible protein DinB
MKEDNGMKAQIIDYHLWANRLVFKHIKELPNGVCFHEVQSVFPSLYDTLFHMYQVDFVWLKVINGDSFEKIVEDINQLKAENLERSLEKLVGNHLQLGDKYLDFLSNLDNLHENITVHHPAFGTLKTSYFELLQHVANHGTYHRGNITAILRQLGYKGIPTDYVYYLFEMQK